MQCFEKMFSGCKAELDFLDKLLCLYEVRGVFNLLQCQLETEDNVVNCFSVNQVEEVVLVNLINFLR
jgi:hypothetical protein